jgi:hypothetical protein
MKKAQRPTPNAIKTILDETDLKQYQFADMIGASLDTVKGWTRKKSPSPISQQFKTRILFATGAAIKDDGSVVAGLTFPTEPFTKDTFAFWRTRIFKSNEVIADRCARRCADSIRRIFRAACPLVPGEKRNLPAVWSSFCDWEADTIKNFNLSRRLSRQLEELERDDLLKDIVFGLHRLYARLNARQRSTQSEEQWIHAMIVEIEKKLALPTKSPRR